MFLQTSELKQSGFIEKVLRNADGRLVRATFEVYENNGRMRARLVHAVFVDETPALHGSKEGLFALSGMVARSAQTSTQLILSAPIVSPYFSSNLLYVAGLQPRAPSVN